MDLSYWENLAREFKASVTPKHATEPTMAEHAEKRFHVVFTFLKEGMRQFSLDQSYWQKMEEHRKDWETVPKNSDTELQHFILRAEMRREWCKHQRTLSRDIEDEMYAQNTIVVK